MDFFKKLLDDREDRYQEQMDLIDKYKKPIISFMLNIPGQEKNKKLYEDFHLKGIEKLEDLFKNLILESIYKNKDTGIYYLAAINMDPVEIKKLAVSLEDSESGRLYDIDVFDSNKKPLSRSDIELEPRKCLLCNKYAKVCMREDNHKKEDLIEYVNELICKNPTLPRC